MRAQFAPLRPEFDNFLYASVGEEVDGMPLSVMSVLTRLDLDPWDEAARLASLAKRDAIAQLAELIGRLPATHGRSIEAGRIAESLIGLLPRSDKIVRAMPSYVQKKASPGQTKLWLIGLILGAADKTKLWLIALILGAAVLVSVVAHGGLPFGGHQPPEPPSTTETPRKSN
jgi:hypothetical protein